MDRERIALSFSSDSRPPSLLSLCRFTATVWQGGEEGERERENAWGVKASEEGETYKKNEEENSLTMVF